MYSNKREPMTIILIITNQYCNCYEWGCSALDAGKLANRLDQIFTDIYSNAMNSIEPKGNHDPNFEKKHDAWDKAFKFTKKLQNYVNDLDSMISNAGKTHSSNDSNITVTEDFVVKLRNVLKSDDFKQNMKIAEPSTSDSKLHTIWEKAFRFPGMLEKFAESIESVLSKAGGKMPFYTFLSMLNSFLNGVEQDLHLPHTSG